MKIITWNVNGLRAVIKKDGLDPVLAQNADILCLQETKLSDGIDIQIPGYEYSYFNNAEKKGYSGVAFFSKKPLNITHHGINEEHPQEGRVLVADCDQFFLVNTYTPNSKRGLLRLDYRTQTWDPLYRNFVSSLAQQKDVLLCGDFNVAHQEIDIANPKANRKNAGFTDQERNQFSSLIDSGFIDVFRARHPNEPNHYTWWSYRFNAKARNIGWRLDYFLATQALYQKITNISILQEVDSSDHAPVVLNL